MFPVITLWTPLFSSCDVSVDSQLLPAYWTLLVFFGSSAAPCWLVCSVCTASWWPPTPGRWSLVQSPLPSVWCPWTCSLAMTRSVAGILSAPKQKRWVSYNGHNIMLIGDPRRFWQVDFDIFGQSKISCFSRLSVFVLSQANQVLDVVLYCTYRHEHLGKNMKDILPKCPTIPPCTSMWLLLWYYLPYIPKYCCPSTDQIVFSFYSKFWAVTSSSWPSHVALLSSIFTSSSRTCGNWDPNTY